MKAKPSARVLSWLFVLLLPGSSKEVIKLHIPDGYLSPQTCAVAAAAMLPVWWSSVRKVQNSVNKKYIPLMALGAAFSFTVMMYNVPIPDGTTAHATGAALLSVIFGPWAASICITIAIFIQALLFGDGGILSLGANCFNMAFVLPFSSYWIYRILTTNSAISSSRRYIAGFFAGYLGLVLASICAAVELGIQPLLFHTSNNMPIYCPYPLWVTVPAMTFAHLTVAGPIEGLVTALSIKYLQVADPFLLKLDSTLQQTASHTQKARLWYGLILMAIFTPLGLLASGSSWGEWSSKELAVQLGFVPSGLESMSKMWQGMMQDYTLPGLGQGFFHSSVGYIISALVGIAAISLITYLFGRAIKNN